MKIYACQACGQLLYFENVRCERCGHTLGFLPDEMMISALEPAQDGAWTALGAKGKSFRFCKNSEFGVCNWMLPAESADAFCAACRHNHIIPDLSSPQNIELWRKLEFAKHRLLYTLLKLRLPLASRVDDPEHGLGFDFLTDDSQPHGQRVLTGHADGLITLAVKEADDAERERVRTQMGEPYRTLLGHFRHESGHYFWDVLVRGTDKLESFRAVFGQEADYGSALAAYHANGPAPDWQQRFVSAYASAHPWEDFAETWAHYLHIIDTLETAQSFGVKVQTKVARSAEKMSVALDFDPHKATDIDQLIKAWLPLCFAVNSMNRSMGQADLYPFILAPATIAKLGYIHELTHGSVAAKPKESAKRAITRPESMKQQQASATTAA